MPKEIEILITGKNGTKSTMKEIEGDLDRIISKTRTLANISQAAMSGNTKKVEQLSHSLGVNVGQGLASGIKSGSPAANQAITNLVNQIIGRTKTQLGIKSPSTVFFNIGQQIISGLTQGIGAGDVAIGNIISDLVGGLVSVAGKAVDLGIQSVKLAADFEQTRNALEIGAGSARRANIEIAALDETARNTRGLRLEAAESGFVHLRNLGFAAESSRKLIAGLATQKMLNPNSDIDRIIVNLTQLSAGSQRASQDIKEIIHSAGSMKSVFQDAFGTSDTKKIGTIFTKDPDKAIEKLAAAMEKVKQPAGSLNDSLDKLTDTALEARRAFGAPILEPLTEGVKGLDKYLRDNKAVWAEWGQWVSDIIRGINVPNPQKVGGFVSESVSPTYKTYGEYFDAYKRGDISWTEMSKATNALTLNKADSTFRDYFGAGNLVKGYADEGANIRKQTEQKNAPKSLADLRQRDDRMFSSESATANQDYWRKEQQKLEIAERKQIELNDAFRKQDIQQAEGYYKILEAKAQAQAHLDYTAEQELSTLQRVSRIRAQSLASEFSIQKKYFDEQIKLNEGNEEDITKLRFERTQVLGKLNGQIKLNEINTQKEIAAKEKQIIEQRRQAQIEFKNLQIQGVGFGVDNQTFDTERLLSHGLISTENGYKALKDLTIKSTSEIRRLNLESFNLQLKDKSLTEEQKKNLQTKFNLDEAKLTEEQRRRLLQIQDSQSQEQIQKLEENLNRRNRILQDSIDTTREILQIGTKDFQYLNFDLLEKALFGGDTYKNLGSRTQESLKTKIAETEQIIKLRQDALKTAQENKPENMFQEDYKRETIKGLESDLKTLNEQLAENKEQLGNWKDLIKEDVVALGDLIEKVRQGTTEIGTYDEIRTRSLERIHAAQTEQLDNEIKAKAAEIQSAIDLKDAKKVEALTYEKSALQSKRSILLFQQNKETAEEYRKTLGGINEEIKLLLQKDPKEIGAIRDIFNHDQAEQMRDSLTQVRYLELQIASPDITEQYRVRLGVLEKTLEIRNREVDAIIKIKQAQIELGEKSKFSSLQSNAKLLDYLNQNTKSLTDIITDTKVKTIESFWGAFDTGISKLTDKLGGFGDILKSVLSDLFKLASANLLAKIFGGGSSQGGFNLGSLFGIGGRGGSSAIGRALGIGGSLAAGVGSASAAGIGTAAGIAGHIGTGAAPAASGGLLALMTNPWTIGIGAGILGGIALWKLGVFGGQSAEKKLKKAALSEYNLRVDDKSTLKQLKAIGEGSFGRGQAGKHAAETVRLEPSREMLLAYAEATGQDTSKLEGEEYFSEYNPKNRFINSPGASALLNSTARKSYSYDIAANRAPVTTPTAPISSPGVGSIGELVETLRELPQVMKKMEATMATNTQMTAYNTEATMAFIENISSMQTDEVAVLMSKSRNGQEAITNAVMSEFERNGNRTEEFMRKTGRV